MREELRPGLKVGDIRSIFKAPPTPFHPCEADRIELVLAGARIFLAAGSLAAILIDPTEPELHAKLAYDVISAYAVYSVAMYGLLRITQRPGERFGATMHIVDVLWVTAITALAQGPNSPFFVFATFVLLGAAFRWGLWKTAGTGGFFVVLLMTEGTIAHGAPVAGQSDVNRLIIRSTYLVLMSVLLGHLADVQKRRAEEL